MPKYIIEREIPNAGALSAAELKAISQKSCGVLQQLGPSIQWVQSYVTEDKITCVYIAPNADIIREHARLGGFPADRVLEVAAIIDPTTAEWNELADGEGVDVRYRFPVCFVSPLPSCALERAPTRRTSAGSAPCSARLRRRRSRPS